MSQNFESHNTLTNSSSNGNGLVCYDEGEGKTMMRGEVIGRNRGGIGKFEEDRYFYFLLNKYFFFFKILNLNLWID